ncbi:MAG: thiamine pyrophosphate-binding protein, partial [Dehalococcoidia bacterium]
MNDERLTTAHIITRVLREEGVQYIFGVAGGSNYAIMKGASEEGIRVTHMRHEQAAPFAADAFARCAHSFGACFLFAGPGYTNATNGITMAYNNRIPMVCLVNQQPTLAEEKGAGA